MDPQAPLELVSTDKESKKLARNAVIIVLVVLVIILFLFFALFSLFGHKSSKTNKSKIPITFQKTSSSKDNSQKSNLPSSTSLLNTSKIDSKKTILNSIDNKRAAVFYYKGPELNKGNLTINFVDIYPDKARKEKTNNHLTGPITESVGVLYWSQINDRVYFTLGTNGIGFYSLWSSNPDGSDQRLVSGAESLTDNNQDITKLKKSAIFGATAIDYSPDGKMILTSRQDTDTGHESSIWIMDIDGNNSRLIPIKERFNDMTAVKWSTDGKYIFFTAWDGTKDSTYITDIKGSAPVKQN